MTKPKPLPPDAEAELEWLRSGGPFKCGALLWTVQADFLLGHTQARAMREEHSERFRVALDPLSSDRRRSAILRYVRLRDRLIEKYERDVNSLTKLKEDYLTAREDSLKPNHKITQRDVAKVIARAKGVDVNDPCNGLYLDDATRHVRASLKRLGYSWDEFKKFVKSYDEPPSEPEDPGWEN